MATTIKIIPEKEWVERVKKRINFYTGICEILTMTLGILKKGLTKEYTEKGLTGDELREAISKDIDPAIIEMHARHTHLRDRNMSLLKQYNFHKQMGTELITFVVLEIPTATYGFTLAELWNEYIEFAGQKRLNQHTYG